MLSNQRKPIAISLNRDQGRKSWADIVVDQPQEPNVEESSLEHFAPIRINNKKYGLVKEEVCKRATESWNNSVLVYVVGTKPYYLFFKSYMQRVWKPLGEFEIFTRENGFFLVKFKESQDCNSVLKNGPYFYNGKLIIMRKLSDSLKMDRDLLMSMPIWVRLPCVNLKLWDLSLIHI